MRRSRLAPLDENRFPLTLANALRAASVDFASAPVPETLATLLSRLDAIDATQNSGIEPQADRGKRQAA
jgi:hypothetical protein